MKHYPLRVGNRIVTINPRMNIPLGTGGTVVKFYGADCYDIQLDGFSAPCVMLGADLMLVPITDTDGATEERAATR